MTQSAQQQQQSAQQQQQDSTRKTASQKQSSSHPTATIEQPVTVHVASHEEIAERAYRIYSNKGRAKGQCQQNWHQAESELRKQQATAENSRSASSTTGTKNKH